MSELWWNYLFIFNQEKYHWPQKFEVENFNRSGSGRQMAEHEASAK